MTAPTLEGTTELMKHRRVAVILATGGAGLVKAAYSSGKPAYGVGPGNVPAYIDRSAHVAKAVRDVVTGKTFDHGTLCSSEQSLIVDRPVEAEVLRQLERLRAYVLSEQEKRQLEAVAILPNRTLNTQVVGKSAQWIADKAGITVPSGTRVLVVRLDGVGREHPLSCEKLSPILAFYVADGWRAGCERCKEVLAFGGMGHTLALHANDPDVVRQFGLEKPAFRICVNTPATHGSIGLSTALPPSMTLGCGTYGNNITTDIATRNPALAQPAPDPGQTRGLGNDRGLPVVVAGRVRGRAARRGGEPGERPRHRRQLPRGARHGPRRRGAASGSAAGCGNLRRTNRIRPKRHRAAPSAAATRGQAGASAEGGRLRLRGGRAQGDPSADEDLRPSEDDHHSGRA